MGVAYNADAVAVRRAEEQAALLACRLHHSPATGLRSGRKTSLPAQISGAREQKSLAHGRPGVDAEHDAAIGRY